MSGEYMLRLSLYLPSPSWDDAGGDSFSAQPAQVETIPNKSRNLAPIVITGCKIALDCLFRNCPIVAPAYAGATELEGF